MLGRSFLLRLIAIIATGLMVAGLLPPYNFATLAWLCLIPLLISLWSLKGKHRAKKGFLIGYLAGAISFGIQLSWLSTVSWLGPIVLASYLSLFFGAFGAFAATIGNPWHQKIKIPETPLRSLLTAFIHATIWAGLEWLRSWLFTGFGWNGLGIAFHDTLVISQAADILGVTGLSLILVFFQSILVQVGHRLMQTSKDGIRRPRWDFTATVLLVGLLLCYGILRIAMESGKESVTLKSLLVQINIPQDAGKVQWTWEDVHIAYEEETLQGLQEISQNDEKRLQEAIEKSKEGSIQLNNPDWVLWPETSLTGRIISTENGEWAAWRQNTETINRVRTAGSFHLIYGAVEIEGEARQGRIYQKENPRIYNSIILQDPQDNLQTFKKRHLVIFGETIPLVDTIPLLKKIYEQQSGAKYSGSFASGPSTAPLETELNGTKIQIIPSVCFEDTVPRLTRKFVRNAPQIIVNLTNDGWFGTSPAAAQHFANARFRAIELRRPMLRCANTGISAAIDTIGSTTHPETGQSQIIQNKQGSSFIRDSLLTETKIPLHPSFSLYSIIGDWGIISLFLTGIITALLNRRKTQAEPKSLNKNTHPS